ncbi:MAG: TetR/AcrR family transcriptional regulator [Candidatus Binatia bacterium]
MVSRRKKAGAVVRNRRGQSTRAAILAAAHRLLKERGFEAVSIDRVARAARVTRSSIYHQFRSRDEFLLHLIAESLRSLQRGGKHRAGGSALERFLDEAEAGFRGDPNLLRMFYQLVFDRGAHGPAVDRLLREAYRFRTSRLAAGLRKDAVGRTDEEAEVLAVVLVATLDGLYARRLIDLGGARLNKALTVIAALVAGRGSAGKRTGQR